MPQPEARPTVPTVVTFAAIVLAACLLLPVDPHEGKSMLDVLLEAFREDWLVGLMVVVVFGSPYAFAIAVVCAGTAGSALASAWVRGQVALLQTEVVVIGLLVLHGMND